MKKLMTAILLTMLARGSYAQEITTCHNPDANTTVCEFADRGATVTYFDPETKNYSRTSYTAQEWKDSLYHKSLVNPPKPEVKPPATTSAPRTAYTKDDPFIPPPVYSGPRTKDECKVAGYKWHKGACNGVKVSK